MATVNHLIDEQATGILLSEVIRPAIADIGVFLDELGIRADNLLNEVPRVRQELERRNRILFCDELIEQNLHAVDAASVILDRQGMAVVVAVGAYIGNNHRARVEYDRKSGENSEDFHSIASALRMRLELSLLHTVEHITIADHSFWSILMESNKVVTAYKRSSPSAEIQMAFRPIIDEAYKEDGTLLQALHNPFVVAISKTATSDRLSDELQISPVIPDRTLMSAVLEPGEYLRPMRLIEATGGRFGVEHEIVGWQEIEQIYKGETNDRLMVTFYRPWEFQRAYRIEYHERIFPPDKLPQLLGRIRYETRIRSFMEPVSQFLADMVCKQVSEIPPLYINAAMYRYPNIMGPYRTGG